MHEFAITSSLISQVIREAEKNGARRIRRITLLIGEHSSVVPECVRFYFNRLKDHPLLKSAELEFRPVPLRLRCPKCGQEFGSIEEMCSCNAGAEITGGDELTVESMEIE
ncbi:MAG: hydrogenase maturation nickel metallochaperone HypA [candidate division WOR-3 bacterium]|uniref:Hydrogenase maturation factor HypA n=1 Tax=candidate division WOR-3 bacterium TaxID=2052148 RepID=A0A7C1SEG0_UNCW3|nr:hydrogenase maturation nickel metallochaperone HypA [candidate division WOR-3 bacterium]